jgi:guanylate kinase
MTTSTITKKAVVRKAASRKSASGKAVKRRGVSKGTLPGAVVTLDGREYFFVSKEEFESWDEDKQLLAVAMERLAEDEELIPAEEVNRYFDELEKNEA